jgi:hypothetical protein
VHAFGATQEHHIGRATGDVGGELVDQQLG